MANKAIASAKVFLIIDTSDFRVKWLLVDTGNFRAKGQAQIIYIINDYDNHIHN